MNKRYNDYIISKRLLFKPWKKIYVLERGFYGFTITENIEEAKVFENLEPSSYMRIEDDFFFTRWKLEEI